MKPIVVTVASVLFACSAAFAQEKWKPYKFQGDERYEFRISSAEGDAKETFYVIDIKSTGKKDSGGQELFEVSYTTRGSVKKSDLGEKTLFGAWDTQGAATGWAMSTAMWSMIFTDLKLKEGEKMSFFGAGVAKVTGKVKIADREGFVCQYFENKDEKEVLSAEWTIDPALALPLKTVMYEEGKPKQTMELVSYKKY